MKLKALLIALAVAMMSSTIHADSIGPKELDDPAEENYIATQKYTQWTPTSATNVWTFSGPTAVLTLTSVFDLPITVDGRVSLEADPAKGHFDVISGQTHQGFTIGLADFTGFDTPIPACLTSSCVTGVVNVWSVELYNPFCQAMTPTTLCEDGGLNASGTLLGSFPSETPSDTTPTPEPGTLLLFGSGIGALGWMKWKGLAAWHAKA